jgi:hypothetical protein
MNPRKGPKNLTVLADLIGTPGKAASVREAFSRVLPWQKRHPKTVQGLAIDMNAAYMRGIRDNFANARVVVDKFHVIQNVVKACDLLRRDKSNSEARKRVMLEQTRWMWLENRVIWTEKETQKWEAMALVRCMTGLAYEMRLVLCGIYKQKDAGEAKRLFKSGVPICIGMRGQTGELLEPMVRAAQMIDGHLEGI